MKFSVASVLAVAALAPMGSNAFAPSYSRHVVPRAGPLSVSATEESTSSADTEERKPTKKEKRLQYMKTDTFHRKGFKEVRENVEKSMEEQFKSSLVDELKKRGVIDKGMRPKVQSAIRALQEGVQRVHFIDGRLPHSLLLEIFTDKGIGTEIEHG